MKKSILSQITLLKRLMAYVFRVMPSAILTILLGIGSSFLELIGLAILLPLAQIAAHQPILPTSVWYKLPKALGFEPDTRFFVLAFFALILTRTLSQLLTSVLTHRVNRQLNALFSTRALEAFIHHLSFSSVQKESIGHFVVVAGDEAVRAAQIVSTVIKIIPLIVLFALYALLITYQSWPVGVGFLVFCVVTLGCLWGAFRKLHELGRQQQDQSREAGTHFIEALSGLRTVRSFTAEDYVTSRYAQMMHEYMRSWFYIDSLNSFGAAVPTIFLSAATLSAIALFVAPSNIAGILPAIMAGIMMVLRLLPLATQALDSALRLTADLRAAENISALLDAVRSASESSAMAQRDIDRPIVHIEFDQVSFRYSDDTLPILDHFSIALEAGKSYAISGPSGAGKSTIVDLLLKFYQPQTGVIRANGVDIEALSNWSLRSRVVLAEQTVRIFHDSIAQNVRFGYDEVPGSVEKCLELVGLNDFIRTLPAGADTMLKFQGGNVSGGQRQRIGLARALLRQADVLIMDESTSALDHTTREKILLSILQHYRDKILIFIAHDPTILEHVDEVIYLTPVNAPVPVAV